MKELFVNDIWSKSKKISSAINILLFLVAINFWHYGQLFLPIICMILFINNKGKLKVDSIFIFIVLLLFAISFFVFSYKQGFYCVMGFCIPMAYYIGCNLTNKTSESVKKIIYIICFGMSAHLILNFIIELIFLDGDIIYIFSKATHNDVWLLVKRMIVSYKDKWVYSKIKTTLTALYLVLPISTIGYVVFFEKNISLKRWFIIIYIITMFYGFALARRTTLIIFVISLIISIKYAIKNNKFDKKAIKILIAIILFLLLLMIIAYNLNLFEFRNTILNLAIVKKILGRGFDTERFQILIDNLKLYPIYLWGGQKISTTTGNLTHDLWGDIYDYAGVIPYILFIIYSIYVLFKYFKINKKNKYEYKYLYINIFVCSCLALFIEPIMTGASIYLISLIIIFTLIISSTKTTELHGDIMK